MLEVEALTKQPVTKMEIPTVSEIHRHRESKVVETLKIWLGRGRYKRDLEMVQALIEAGHDPWNIAAAAIKIARADEKQRPIAEIGEVKSDRHEKDLSRSGKRESFERRERSDKGSSMRRRGAESHEDGMVRLKLNKGKMHGVRPGDIVGTILIPLLQAHPDFLYYMALAFAGGIGGVLLSPLHLCLILTKEYFRVEWKGVYQLVWFPVASILIAGLVWVVLFSVS